MGVLASEMGWPSYQVSAVERWRGDEHANQEDCIAEEAPIALMYNGEPHVVMLATPLDLEDFALGFSLTENIVASPREVESVRIYRRAEGIEVRLRIPEARCANAAEKGRNLAGRTGCGLCGARTLQQAMRRPAPVGRGVEVSSQELERALGELSDHQRLNRITGAVHAAAWAVPGQGIRSVREDIGRHNALDKLIGGLARRDIDFATGFVLVTSRASYEMVQKCASVGIGFLAAISAPTGLAVRLAEDTGVTLVGFARGENHVVYANPQRLLHGQA
ncbi:NAD-linked formate dehydrogenase, molybdenum containing, accessory protein [Methylocaldum marinum]|uniref:Sulfur carrier protein FdhD n=1 Tax=Methylocaldum marinum TaxID=1432792 RepID=A0A286P3R1_9GAMM|nr:formate dehydrogenase accessory sulfurtransferase FdhD [Methylocaldum marinum]BBA32283.1 NAD-linked formate dehydrogenase, molybdenum containing, accessory protein [Methylocaldum marinum]